MTFPMPTMPAFAAGATLSFNESTSNPIADQTTAASPRTFSAVDFGNPADKSDRIAIVVVTLAGDAAAFLLDITNVTIGGTSATKLLDVTHTGGSNEVAICHVYALLLTTGTTADVVVTIANAGTGGAAQKVGIAAYWAKGIGTNPATIAHDTLSATAADPLTGTINVLEGGAVVAGAAVSSNSNFAWTGATENYDYAGSGGSITTAAASGLSAETGRTITADQVTAGTAQALGAVSLKNAA